MRSSVFDLAFCFFAMSFTAAGQPKIVAIVNSASFQSGIPAGGALATAFVSGLTGLSPGVYSASLSQPLPHSLGGVTVSVNDDYAPLLAVVVPSDPTANVQVNFQVPLSSNASLMYNYFVGDGPVYAGYVSINNAVQAGAGTVTGQWGGFFAQANGVAAAVHASDMSLVTAQNPARPGESIIAYADDFFMTWPPPPIGIAAPQGVTFQLDYPFVRPLGNLYLQNYPVPTSCPPPIGGAPDCYSATNTPALTINSMGLAPGLIGVEEISFVVPATQQAGNSWALFFNRGSCPDGSGIPGSCGASAGISSPYVLLPVQ